MNKFSSVIYSLALLLPLTLTQNVRADIITVDFTAQVDHHQFRDVEVIFNDENVFCHAVRFWWLCCLQVPAIRPDT